MKLKLKLNKELIEKTMNENNEEVMTPISAEYSVNFYITI